jgi:hypothetical protein
MYLREMGSVELLSREGEIAIAKRIEAGRDAMISGLCESALTFEAIMVWRDELGNNRILLREVIDLDATYGVLNPSSLPHNQPPAGEASNRPSPRKRPKPAKRSRKARRRRRRFRRRRRSVDLSAWKPSCAKASWKCWTPSPRSSAASASCRTSWSAAPQGRGPERQGPQGL